MRRRLHNRLGLLAAITTLAIAGQASIAQADFGVTPEHFATGLTGEQAGLAGAPADYHVSFEFNARQGTSNAAPPPEGTPKQVDVELPPGLIGNPTKIPECTNGQIGVITINPHCPADRAVGFAAFKLYDPSKGTYYPSSGTFNGRIFRVPTIGNEAAAFAFSAVSYLVRISITVDPENGYRIRAHALNLNESLPLVSADVTFWGVPQEHSGPGSLTELAQGTFGGPQPVGVPRTRFMSTPTNCDRASLETTMTLTSWQTKQPIAPISSLIPGVTGCNELTFDPSISVTPENKAAGAPSGYQVDLTVPQNEEPFARITPNLKDAVVHLPAGLAISPPQADGLDACTDEQLGLHTSAPAACPEASKIGSLQIDTPLLEEPVLGSVYIGSQLSNNPESGQMYRIFLVGSAPGALIKLSGAISANAQTGQLTATFNENPELPFSKFTLNLRGGPRATLVNPSTCGTYTTTSSLSSWAGQAAAPRSSFVIDQNCDGRSRFTPGFEAGTRDSAAGTYSPFTLRVTRLEGQQNISRIDATLPPGLLAKLAGVPLCGDAEAVGGNCPPASQVGTTTVAAGEGTDPLYVPQPGKAPTGVYLAGPYKGAPYSLVVKVPAQAGPFDLGTVTVRNALHVDPTTTQVSATSDSLPQILGGVPIAYRDIRIDIDRPGFTLNPTSCGAMRVGGTIASPSGTVADVDNRFQSVNCAGLGFGPKLALSLKGGTTRAKNPALKAVLTAPAGQANIGKVQVVLPKSVFIDNRHIDNPCTRIQFDDGAGNGSACPPKSILGKATAWSPLLDRPLTGPVYFRSNGGERKLPDLVASLDGQIHVNLVGFIDSVHKKGTQTSRTRNTFASVPDAPVSRFVLELQGGKKGLLQNSTNLCKSTNKATVRMDGQNGKAHDFKTVVRPTSCSAKKKPKKK
jgi:hypothetical protein